MKKKQTKTIFEELELERKQENIFEVLDEEKRKSNNVSAKKKEPDLMTINIFDGLSRARSLAIY